MSSLKFKALLLRIETLRATFLPSQFDPTGTYSQADFDKATAFRLLTHSEFESFAEEIIKSTVEEAFNKWKATKKVSLPIVCILASYEGKEKINAFTSNSPDKRPLSISTLIYKSFNHFKSNVTGNNGIRTKDLLALLIQVGIEEADCDATWVGEVDAFGAHRNIVGHRSNMIAYQADPKTALEAAQTICRGFEEIDKKLVSLRATFHDYATVFDNG